MDTFVKTDGRTRDQAGGLVRRPPPSTATECSRYDRAGVNRDRPVIEFCGQFTAIDGDRFVIGRHGDLSLDADNRFLHRQFLAVYQEQDLWFLVNIGGGTSATVADGHQRSVTTLGPGAALPLTEALYRIRCTAGPTRYELEIHMPSRVGPDGVVGSDPDGDKTEGRLTLTPDQKLLILSLAEPALRGHHQPILAMPTSNQAASMLGWTISKFNRKLDNVCQKFTRLGVRGLHGEIGNLAFQRRVRLVEHAVSSRTVTPADLTLLDAAVSAIRDG